MILHIFLKSDYYDKQRNDKVIFLAQGAPWKFHQEVKFDALHVTGTQFRRTSAQREAQSCQLDDKPCAPCGIVQSCQLASHTCRQRLQWYRAIGSRDEHMETFYMTDSSGDYGITHELHN